MTGRSLTPKSEYKQCSAEAFKQPLDHLLICIKMSKISFFNDLSGVKNTLNFPCEMVVQDMTAKSEISVRY